jgi:hypothetical protein
MRGGYGKVRVNFEIEETLREKGWKWFVLKVSVYAVYRSHHIIFF